MDFGLANHLDLPDLIYESFPEPKGTPAYIALTVHRGPRRPGPTSFDRDDALRDDDREASFPRRADRVGSSSGSRRRNPPRKYNPAFSDAFEFLVLNCLRTNPDERFNSMEELYETLGLWEQEIPIRGSSSSPQKRRRPPERPSVTAALKRISRLISRIWEKNQDDFRAPEAMGRRPRAVEGTRLPGSSSRSTWDRTRRRGS